MTLRAGPPEARARSGTSIGGPPASRWCQGPE
jgi:hypothetical protein